MAIQIETEGPPAETLEQARLDARLDAALSMTFPASDPIAIFVERSGAGRSQGKMISKVCGNGEHN
jgi:hypothetical protein